LAYHTISYFNDLSCEILDGKLFFKSVTVAIRKVTICPAIMHIQHMILSYPDIEINPEDIFCNS